MAIFQNLQLQDEDILYLCEYVPENRCRTDEGEYRDTRSTDFVLAFKHNKPYAVEAVLNDLYPQLGNHFALVAFPSSKVKGNYISPSHTLIHRLVERATRDNGKSDITDASECLYRYKDIQKQHLSSGSRNANIHLDSIELRHPELIQGKDVLVIDDITTSGSSMRAAFQMLKEHGAKSVIGFVVGRTIGNANLRTGVMFDLDQTLFDTSLAKPFREQRDWKQAEKIAELLEPYDGVPELIQMLRKHGCDICVVTTSPRQYAQILTRKLGIPDNRLVAYHDVKKHKPDPEGYFAGKVLMHIYDPCCIVIGDDEEKDILPAQDIGMTTVHAGWSGKSCESADFAFGSVHELIESLDEVLERSRKIQSVLRK